MSREILEATDVRIEMRAGAPFEVPVKRLYLPGTIRARCPKCGREHEIDLERYHLSFPTAFGVDRETYECRDEDCAQEFAVHFVMEISVRAATPEEREKGR